MIKEGKVEEDSGEELEELEDSEISESRKRKTHKAYKSMIKKCIRAMEPSFDEWVIGRHSFNFNKI